MGAALLKGMLQQPLHAMGPAAEQPQSEQWIPCLETGARMSSGSTINTPWPLMGVSMGPAWNQFEFDSL